VRDDALPTTATATPEELAEPARSIGGQIDRYVLLREIGAGGMGTVWEAYDPQLDRLIALKLVLDPAGGSSGAETTSLEREARALARVTDPHVVAVFDGGRDGAMVYIAMELVRGRTLKEWLAEHAWPAQRIVDVMLTAGRGLEAVHRAGLVHRDIKPSNILIGNDGRVCVSDLGIALAESLARGSGAYAGTPAYMAPEQRERKGADARSDQYAFCATAWEALGGTLPPQTARPIPAALRGALERGLHADPAERWPALADLLVVIERWRGRARRRWIAAAAAVALAAAVAVTFIVTREPARTDVCAATTREIDGVWTKARRAELAAAFAAVPSPIAVAAWERTDGVLAAWVDRWRAARVQACDETTVRRTQPAAVLARRESCLARRADQLDALLGALATPDAMSAPLAVSAAWGLSAPESCLAPSPPDAPAPEPDAAPIRALHQRLARTEALRRLGKPVDAVAAAEAIMRDAESTGDRGLLAQAYTELGHCHAVASNQDASIEALRKAITAADGAGLDDVRFAAWAQLGFVIGEIKADKAEGARILEQLHAIYDRLPPDSRREAVLEERTGAYHRIHGDYVACIEHATRSHELRKQNDPTNLDAIAEPLNLVGICLERSAHERQAIEVFEQVLDLRRRSIGEDHPRTAMIYNNLASVAHSLGQYEKSEREHKKALAIRERVLGPDHRDVAQSHNNLANTLTKMGRPDGALVHARAARDIWAKSVGPRTVLTATATAVMGHAERALGHLDEAEALYREALGIRLEVRGPNHEDVTRVLGDLAKVMVMKGKIPEAIAFADDAWKRDVARGDTGIDQASNEIDHLMIHAADPRRRAAAVERIRALCPALADPDWVVEKADCGAFVARGGAPLPPTR